MILTTATTPDGMQVLHSLFAGIRPFLPHLLILFAIGVVLAAPLPGRGPGWSARRDPWRNFKFDARRHVMDRASGRCEAPVLLAWGRCHKHATEADHIYPWSKGGATVVSNGQALCTHHNKSKGARTPPWWYVLGLERRRRAYFPTGVEVRVAAGMTQSDRAVRANSTR